MCGIVGLRRSFLLSQGTGQGVQETIDAALVTLRWRGPDDSRSLIVGDWCLGVARLSITDPASPQPLVEAGSGRVVVHNGAFTSARFERAVAGAALRTGNDAELALYRLRQSEQLLAATSGPYAFAIVDPNEDVLWLGRDPLGEKPLYVVREGEQVIAFASTLPALHACGFKTHLEPAAMGRFFRFGFGARPTLPARWSLDDALQGIFVQRRGDVLRPIPCPPSAAAERSTGTNKGPVGDLRQIITRAAARCADAEVNVALCLSGGLDSACIAVALSDTGRKVPLYQFRAHGTPDDERRRAAAVAALLGMPLIHVDGGQELLAALPDLTVHTGLPQGDPSVLAVHHVARAAAADGARVLLSGEGGDDLFLGYRRDRAARFLPPFALPVPAPRFAMGEGARLFRALCARDPFSALLEVSPPGFRRMVFDSGHVPMLDLPSGGGTGLSRAAFVEREIYLRQDLLPKLDTATMAAGVEGRCPLLDPEVLTSEAALSPPGRRLGKCHLRAAFAADLPDEVVTGRKLGFGLPIDRWLREGGFLADLLHDRSTQERSHLRRDGLRAMLHRQRRGVQLGHALYLIAAFELHLRTLDVKVDTK